MARSSDASLGGGPRNGRRRLLEGHGGLIATVIVVAAVIILLAATCPDKARHKEAISSQLSQEPVEIDDPTDSWVVISGMLASDMGDIVMDRMLYVDNYIVFSIGNIRLVDRVRTISFGVLGHVFTFDSDYMERSLDEE